MKNLKRLICCTFLFSLVPSLAMATPSNIQLRVNQHPVPVYAINEYADKTFVQFWDPYGKYLYYSWIELDNLSRTFKYRNAANNSTGLENFVECSGEYQTLPQAEGSNTTAYGVEFTMDNCLGQDITLLLYFENALYPSSDAVPVCDQATETITALEAERTEFESLVSQLREEIKVKETSIITIKTDTSKFQELVSSLGRENDLLREKNRRLKHRVRVLRNRLGL